MDQFQDKGRKLNPLNFWAEWLKKFCVKPELLGGDGAKPEHKSYQLPGAERNEISCTDLCCRCGQVGVGCLCPRRPGIKTDISNLKRMGQI